MGRLVAFRLLALFALLWPETGQAASTAADPPAAGKALILLPTTVTKVDDLDFGMLAVTTAGTAVLDPNTGVLTTTGGVLVMGGSAQPAWFIATSPSKNVVKITLPNKATTLTRVGGTETMTVDTWNINGNTTRNVVAHEQFDIKVGATLHVNASQVEGLYAGTFDVTINYN